MSYSIVYSSKTGNTTLLAEKLRGCLHGTKPLYFGTPTSDLPDGDIIFAGFPTDKGGCDEVMSAYLQGLHGKKVFLFGTAGFGGDPEYFAKILSRVKAHLDSSNRVLGSYMCQGKMPPSVRKRYEAMAAQDAAKAEIMIGNFDKALPHPDTVDLDGLECAVIRVIEEENLCL